MKIVSWNMNKRKAGCWEWILDSVDPDVVMAQEASPLPHGIDASVRSTTKKTNRSVFYSKQSNHEVVKVESDHGMGLQVVRHLNIFFINVYANLDFKPVDPPLLGYISKFVANVRRRHHARHILIAGDFNMDRRMDENPTGTKFALKNTHPTNNFFDAILDMGFYDCMRKFNDSPVQTHRNARSTFPWELDHMFVTRELFESLTGVEVPDRRTLSDHDPIVADFDLATLNQE